LNPNPGRPTLKTVGPDATRAIRARTQPGAQPVSIGDLSGGRADPDTGVARPSRCSGGLAADSRQ